jgi:hypothetical protein
MDINKTEMLYGLYGSYIARNKAVGFCKHHNAALTVKTLKCHNCLGKQCNALKKYEEHDFWRQHEQRKQLRKAKKQMIINVAV